MVSPVIHMRRTAVEDTEINGQPIAKDEKVVLWYGAANRDPDIFPDPDTFNLHRDNVEKHLAFGRFSVENRSKNVDDQRVCQKSLKKRVPGASSGPQIRFWTDFWVAAGLQDGLLGPTFGRLSPTFGRLLATFGRL